MRERRAPTHVLTIEVPLYVDGDFDFDPFQHTLKAVLSISHIAFADALCDDPQVSVREEDS